MIATVLLLVLEGFLLWTVVFPGLGSPDFDYIPFFVALIPIAIADFVVLLVFSVYVLR